MGCLNSKEIFYGVYVEMLRRLNVEPTRSPDASSTAKRSNEFKRIASEKGSRPLLKEKVNVEMLLCHDDNYWKATSVHYFNEELVGQGVEDVTLLNTVGAGWVSSVLSVSPEIFSRSRFELRRWDYRFWLLYMCEFYRIMSIFEKAKVLKKKDWRGVVVDEKILKKCMKLLISELEIAFASDAGPGDAFRPPSSATPEAILRQVSIFIFNGTTTEPQSNGVSLLVLVRWLLLRHLNAMRCEEDTPPPRELMDSREISDADVNSKLPFHDILQDKLKGLDDALSNENGSDVLEELFIKWTHGTRILSESGAATESFKHFEMGDLFSDFNVYEELVGLAFRAALKAENSANPIKQPDSNITNVPTFSQFLRAYKGVLWLYSRTVDSCGSKRKDKLLYGLPPPSIPRGSISQVIPEEDVDYVEAAVSRALVGKKKNAHAIPFPILADAFLMRLLGQDLISTSLGDLYTVLGLGDSVRRGVLLGLLHDHGWSDDMNPTSSFEAIQDLIDLGSYCGLSDLACDSARSQWVSEVSNSLPDDRVGNADGPEILRLLHGIYGVFVTACVLERTPIPEVEDLTKNIEEVGEAEEGWGELDDKIVEEDKEKSPQNDSLRDNTPLPMSVRGEVLRAMGVSFDIPRLIQSAKEPDDSSVAASCATVSGLIAYAASLYLQKKQKEWRESAVDHLSKLWPIDSNHTTQAKDLFSVLSKKNKRDVVIDTDKDESDFCPIINDFFESYKKDLVFVVSREKFRGICRKAACVACKLNKGRLAITLENLLPFSLYILYYLKALAAFDISETPTRSEVWQWFSQCLGDKVNKSAFDALFDRNAIPGTDTITVETLADMCGRLASKKVDFEDMLRIWTREIRNVLPIRSNATDRAIRAEIAEVVTEPDGYVPTEAIETLLIERYGIERVTPPEFDDIFIAASVQCTNQVLEREDLRGNEFHSTDLRFLLLYIHTYLEVYLKGMKAMSSGRESSESSSRLMWDSPQLRNKLSILMKSCEIGDHIDIESLLKDKSEPWSTIQLADVLARANVVEAIRLYFLRHRKVYDANSLWGRLRSRLPIEDTPAHRLQRQKLFTFMDTGNRKLLTVADLMRGLVGVLALNDFREDLQPLLFHAFVATKEVTFNTHDVVYLTAGNEQFITAPEFFVFLFYLFTYFQMYYMFDVLCAGFADLTKELPAACFEREKATLKYWGIHFDNPIKGFASVNRRCKSGGPLFFAGFVEWASQHHLTPEGYSHEEASDCDSE